MAEYPKLPYGNLHPHEAAFLHPKHWKGQTIGTDPVERHRGVRLGTRLGLKVGARVALEAERMHDALRTQYPPGAVQYYGPGDQLRPADHPDKIIVLDQSTALSRAAIRLDAAEFPEHPPYAFPQQPPAGPIWLEGPHAVLLREPSPVFRTTAHVAVGAGNHEEAELNVRGSSLDKRLSGNALGVQVSVLAVPDVIDVGAVQHTVLPGGGQEMLTVTHNAYVYPRMFGPR